MKNKIIWVLLVLALFTAFSGCKKDEGDDSYFLPGAVPASSVQDFKGTAVKSVSEAVKLYNDAFETNFLPQLLTANKTAHDNAFKAKYGGDMEKYMKDYIKEHPDAESGEYNIDINDKSALAKLMASVTTGIISGSDYGYSGTNLKLKDVITAMLDTEVEDAFKNSGDYFDTSVSGSRVFEITKGFYEEAKGGIIYKIAGYITVEYSQNDSKYLKDKAKKIFSQSNNGTRNISMTLSISDGTSGGKFIISAAEDYYETKDYIRDTSSGENKAESVLEVYNNDDELIFAIPNGFNSQIWFAEFVEGNNSL